MYRLKALIGILVRILRFIKSKILIRSLNLFITIMSKIQAPNYINTTDIKKASEVDLKKALKEVNQKNKDIRESFRMGKDTLAFRTGR